MVGIEDVKHGYMQQLKPLTLRRNFSWIFAGNVIYAACQWGMLVVLAKLGSPEMVGQFTLGLAVTAPVVMFANLQLRVIQATDAKHQYVFGDYLGLRLISSGLALVAILAIALAAGYRRETTLVILVVGLAKVVESISDVIHGLIQQHEQMDRIAVSMMLKGSLSLLLLSAGVYLTGSVLWGTLGLAIAGAVVLASYDLRSGAIVLNSFSTSQNQKNLDFNSAIALRPRWHLRTLAKLLWLALPLGFVMMLISLNVNIPNYFIERYLGERELGVFAAIAYLMVAGNMVVQALADSSSPRLAKYYAAGNSKAFRTLLLKLAGVGALLGGTGVLVAIVAGREILTLLYRPEYAVHTELFVWLMVVAGIGYVSSFLGHGMTAARYLRIQCPLFALTTSITAIACLWLIPTYGLRGVAIALLISIIIRISMSLGVIFHALHAIQPQHPKASER